MHGSYYKLETDIEDTDRETTEWLNAIGDITETELDETKSYYHLEQDTLELNEEELDDIPW